MTTLPFDAAASPAAVEEGQLAGTLQVRLAERLTSLRRRVTGPASLEQTIAIVGGMLAAAGVVVVLLGWYGASRTSRVYLQIPYLISGGLLGVVLAFAGGCAYLASWLTRIAQDQRTRADEAIAAARETTAALARIEALLSGTVVAGSVATAATGLVATPSGKLAHLPSCPAVAGRTDLRSATVGPGGLAPCRMCDPA